MLLTHASSLADRESPAGPDRSFRSLVPLVPAAVSSMLYGFTLAPEINAGDPAELALQAYQLGVTHPPGYPTHTFLGYLFGLPFTDPSVGTRLLSAVCTSVAVGVASLILLRSTHQVLPSLAAGLILAVIPKIWRAAIVTEVYSVSLCFVALTILAGLLWVERPRRLTLITSGVLYGVALGASLANVLLWPGFVVLIAGRAQHKVRSTLLFVLFTAAAGGIVSSWSYVRSRTLLPIGTEFIPNTLGGFFDHLSGREYQALQLNPPMFYLNRVVEHGAIFTRNCFGLGVVLGLIGFAYHVKNARLVAASFAIMFAANFGYFTGYAWFDYHTMVNTSYFLFALWIGLGVARLLQHPASTFRRAVAIGVPAVIVVGLFAFQIRERIALRSATPVTDHATAAFEVLPQGALVVVDWGHLTPMLFFQRVYGRRPDLTLIEGRDKPRHYAWGIVEDGYRYARQVATDRPVCADTLCATLDGMEHYAPLAPGWFLYQPPGR